MEFKLEKDNKLFCLQNNVWSQIELKPCFPRSNSVEFYSVRDEMGEEIKLIESLNSLDRQNFEIVEAYLKLRNFLFEIIGIYSIEEDFGLRHFEVKTTTGDRSFQTKLDDWPQQNTNGEILIECLHREQYVIKQLEFGKACIKAYL